MTLEQDETGKPYAKERDKQVLQQADKRGVQVQTFASETLHPLEKYVDLSPGGAGGTLGVPNTITSFQKLFAQLGKVPLLLEAPTKFPPWDDQQRQTMMPPKMATDLPWPRNIPKSQVTPLWGPKE